MRSKFDEQLHMLNTHLTEMGALCEDAISPAVKYLEEGDEKMKSACIEADKKIDLKERDIESLCMKLLLRQQPVARDLRLISSALKMISDMERIGDQASDIAEIAPYVTKSGLESKTHISDMAKASIKMVTESVESFVRDDFSLAQNAIAHDDVVDSLFDKVKKEVIEAIEKKSGNAEALIDLLMIAKYFERIGDHAENIAEWVIFSETGIHK
jgi:phosphate transport system protein